MLRNYLKIAWRNLFRNRLLSVINLIGLAVSVAFCLLLVFHIRYEQSFDTFHAKKDRLYRCEMTQFFIAPKDTVKKGFWSLLTKDNDEQRGLIFPLIAGPDVQAAFPEVASYTRLMNTSSTLIRAAKEVYEEKACLYTDDNFFLNFSFPLEKGDAKTVLASPGNVVLSASAAKKYFGDKDPIGQTISLVDDSDRLFRVTGVAADAPVNSSIQYTMVFPIRSRPEYQEYINERFNHYNCNLILELKPGTDAAAFDRKLTIWAKDYMGDEVRKDQSTGEERLSRFNWYLRPFADCHYNVSSVWGHYTDAKAIYQLGCIVAVILLLASLNYVLITVSNAAARTQEIGVRKVMGARRRNVILQFWVETQLLVGFAVVLGLAVAAAGVPLLRSAIGSGLTYASLSWKEVWVAALVLALLLGLLAGYYPAMLISRLKPVSIIRSGGTFRINPKFSRVLVVVQFTCCVVLMMAAFVIQRQMSFINHKDLGFDREQVLVVHNPTFDGALTARFKDRLYAFARTQPSILHYTCMAGNLTGGGDMNSLILQGQQYWLKMMRVDYDYFGMMGLKVVEGRSFSPQYHTDTAVAARPVVVNETLFRMLGKNARLGVYNEAIRGTIIGVVPDYNFESLSRKIGPEMHPLIRKYISDFLFRLKAGQTEAVIAAMQAEWRGITKDYPFQYTFLDESIAQMYAADMRWQKAISASCFFAILIACMGLFGLSAINAVNRTKEIGIRKVLGATIKDLVATLSSEFVGMVALSIIIAAPLGWWLMNKWLEDFAYRIGIDWWMFVVVGAAALAVALGTVSVQVWRAARANPVEALRNE